MKYPMANFVANCPACGKPVGDEHPYTWCAECGEKLPKEITAKLKRLVGSQEATADHSGQPDGDNAPAGGSLVQHPVSHGSLGFCVTVGVIMLLVGWYYLFNPSEGGSSTVNLQRLAIGVTASIVGAIFLASAVRPR